MLDLLIFFTVGLVFFAVFYALGGKKRALQQDIEKLKSRVSQKPHGGIQDLSLRRKANEGSGLLSLLARPLPNIGKLGDRLERAGINLSPRQYMLRRIFWVLGFTFVIGIVLKKSLLLGFFVGIILGVWLPLKLIQRKIAKENKAFLRIFPDAIDLIVRGLRSGLPVSESIVLVSTEVPEPVGGIFLNLSNTMKLGVTLEKALQETARKLDLTEFNFFTTSIILQRETGGNLSEILNNLSEVLRGRYIMSMKIKAMSSEARASAMIIGALPFIVILAVGVLSPGYLRPLIDDHRGNIAAITAACMMAFGLWVMNRMTKFEI
ncbi:MAG: type II secretion system F family protein [Alphaproteobacteria bacterium]|nr:type II secretion system F family protein [Alphaproteobacteria bacterium]